MQKQIRGISIIKSGNIPCLTERGGRYSNTGEAQIITDAKGFPKRALLVPRYGDLCNGDHAYIPIRNGDHVVTVKRHWNRVMVYIERIIGIQTKKAILAVETQPICMNAVNAAVAKSNDYHCCRPYYCIF